MNVVSWIQIEKINYLQHWISSGSVGLSTSIEIMGFFFFGLNSKKNKLVSKWYMNKNSNIQLTGVVEMGWTM